MKSTAALTLCLGFLVLLSSPPFPGHFEDFARSLGDLGDRGDRGELEDVSRFLAANDSDTDTRMADVLVVLDFTVSAWQRQQQAEFAAALVGNASATNSSWRLNFGFVLLKGNVSYALSLTDDYSMLQQQLLDPNFTTVPDTPTTPSGMILRLQRNTAEALRLCGQEIDRRGLFPPLSTAVLLLTAGLSQNGENAPGTIERAAELKVAQKAVLYAIALDDPVSRTPSRNLELQNMATDQSKEFNVILPPAPTTTGTVTTSTYTSATSTATSSTRTTSTATSKTVTGTTSTTRTSTTMTSTSMTSTSLTATTSTATTSTKTSSTQTTITATTTSSTSSSATKTTSTSSTITATTTSSTSSSATKTSSTSSTVTATTTSSTSSSATRTTSTSSTATVTTSTSSTATATSTSSTSSSATITTSTATTSTATTSTATSATSTSTETTSTTTSSTTNETENATFTTTTATTTYEASNESNETATTTSTTDTTTYLTATTTDDDRRLFGDSNAIDIRELGWMIEDESRRLFGSSNVDIRDLGSLLGVELLQFFTVLFVSLETTSSTAGPEIPSAGGLAAGIVVVIVLSTCCLIAVLMAIAFFVWHSMRSSGAVRDEVHPTPTPVLPPLPPAPRPAPAPVPRDATQRALKEAIDMQDITRLRNLLSEILLKGWPEKKYTDLVLKALEVVATLKETAAEVLEQALSEGSLPSSALADARLAGVERELLSRAEGLRQRSAGGTAGTLG